MNHFNFPKGKASLPKHTNGQYKIRQAMAFLVQSSSKQCILKNEVPTSSCKGILGMQHSYYLLGPICTLIWKGRLVWVSTIFAHFHHSPVGPNSELTNRFHFPKARPIFQKRATGQYTIHQATAFLVQTSRKKAETYLSAICNGQFSMHLLLMWNDC